MVVHPLGIGVGIKPMAQPRIKRRGGKLDFYRPFELGPAPYKHFANVTNADELMEFVNKFGPLTTAGVKPDVGDRIPQLLAHAYAMQEMLKAAARNDKSEISIARHTVMPFARLDVDLVFDPAVQRLQLQIKPPSLLEALWLSLAQGLSSQGNLSQCRQCAVWFETGPGTGRRLDAKFCSDEHRIAFNSLKRSKGRAR